MGLLGDISGWGDSANAIVDSTPAAENEAIRACIFETCISESFRLRKSRVSGRRRSAHARSPPSCRQQQAQWQRRLADQDGLELREPQFVERSQVAGPKHIERLSDSKRFAPPNARPRHSRSERSALGGQSSAASRASHPQQSGAAHPYATGRSCGCDHGGSEQAEFAHRAGHPADAAMAMIEPRYWVSVGSTLIRFIAACIAQSPCRSASAR